MIPTKELQRPVSLVVAPLLDDHLELSRLVAAASVNPSFCRLLLINPKLAIENGYQGETFLLGEAERTLILSIRANSLVELAQHLVQALGMGLHTQSPSFAKAPDFTGI
ncbi:MAG: hypothetical protein WCE68_13185 [Anaerolineales bacterium]